MNCLYYRLGHLEFGFRVVDRPGFAILCLKVEVADSKWNCNGRRDGREAQGPPSRIKLLVHVTDSWLGAIFSITITFT